MVYTRLLAVFAGVTALGLAGCSTTGNSTGDRQQADASASDPATQQTTTSDTDQQPGAPTHQMGDEAALLLPPSAKPGECYARVFVPPTYKSTTERVLKQGASERLEITPAEYEWIEERVLVKEASEEGKLVSAKYEWQQEEVLVSEASEKLLDVPATYENVTEQILVKPAYTTWKKGRGPIEKMDNATGEIMCLVEVPAEYRAVTKRVMKTSPGTRKVAVPAAYKTVKRKVMVSPPRMEKITIPAEYKTVRVKKVVTAAKERRIQIPEEFQTVSKREKASDGYLQWRPILCETNASPDLISRVQRALQNEGHYPGSIDGILGRNTMTAVNAYQRSKGLATGQLTIETISALGVDPK